MYSAPHVSKSKIKSSATLGRHINRKKQITERRIVMVRQFGAVDLVR